MQGYTCQPCNAAFPNEQGWQQHLLSPQHLAVVESILGASVTSLTGAFQTGPAFGGAPSPAAPPSQAFLQPRQLPPQMPPPQPETQLLPSGPSLHGLPSISPSALQQLALMQLQMQHALAFGLQDPLRAALLQAQGAPLLQPPGGLHPFGSSLFTLGAKPPLSGRRTRQGVKSQPTHHVVKKHPRAPARPPAQAHDSGRCRNCGSGSHLLKECPHDVICTRCGRPGHTHHICPLDRAPDAPPATRDGRRPLREAPQSTEPLLPCPKEGGCRNCGAFDHALRQCPVEVSCSKCQRKGHTRHVCPEGGTSRKGTGSTPFDNVTSETFGRRSPVARDGPDSDSAPPPPPVISMPFGTASPLLTMSFGAGASDTPFSFRDTDAVPEEDAAEREAELLREAEERARAVEEAKSAWTAF